MSAIDHRLATGWGRGSLLALVSVLAVLLFPATAHAEGGATFLGRQGIEQVLFHALSKSYWQGRYEEAEVKLDPLARDFPSRGRITIETLLWDKRSKRFSAHVAVRAAMAGSPLKREKRFSLSGSAEPLVSVLSLQRARERGGRLQRGDLVLISLPAGRALQNALSEIEHALGKEVRYRLKAGTILRSTHLREPRFVHRRRPVLLLYESDGLRMTVRGLALEDGSEGQSVRVRNNASGVEVEGIVVGDGRISVSNAQPLVSPNSMSPYSMSPYSMSRRHAFDNPFLEHNLP